jgi:serine/threonine-protein kinase HipA
VTVAAVNLWGRRIGAVSQERAEEPAIFEYEPEFARSGIEVSPLRMPATETPYRFPARSPTRCPTTSATP